MGWELSAVEIQSSRHCSTPTQKTPLDQTTWSLLKSLGILRRFRGCRRGQSSSNTTKLHPIKSIISQQRSSSLNIQEHVRPTRSTSSTNI